MSASRCAAMTGCELKTAMIERTVRKP